MASDQASLAEQKTKPLWYWVKLALTLAALAGLVQFCRENTDALAGIKEVRIPWLFALAGLSIALLLSRAAGLRVAHYRVLPGVSFLRWSAIAFVTTTLNLLLVSSAGAAWRAVTLKAHRSVRILDSLAIQLWLFFSIGLCAAIALAIGALAADLDGALRGYLLAVASIGAGLSIAALGVAWQAARRGKPANESTSKVQKIIASAAAIGINSGSLLRLNLVSALNLVLASAVVYAGFAAMGIELPIFVALIFGALFNLSTIVTITPGNIGIVEGVVGTMAALINRDVESAVTAMLVVRAINLASVVLPVPLALLVLKRWNQASPAEA